MEALFLPTAVQGCKIANWLFVHVNPAWWVLCALIRHMLCMVCTAWHWMAACRKLKLWESFCFSCGCERCSSEVDCLAGIPCQACAPPAFKRDKQGMLPGGEHGSSAAAHSSSSSPVGVLRFHPELATGSANNISSSTTGDEVPHVSKPWQCSKCGVWLPDEDAALFGPQLAGPDPCGESSRIESYLWHYVKWVCDENPRGVEMGQLMQLMHDVQQFVGPYHWATHYVLRVRAGERCPKAQRLLYHCLLCCKSNYGKLWCAVDCS